MGGARCPEHTGGRIVRTFPTPPLQLECAADMRRSARGGEVLVCGISRARATRSVALPWNTAYDSPRPCFTAINGGPHADAFRFSACFHSCLRCGGRVCGARPAAQGEHLG